MPHSGDSNDSFSVVYRIDYPIGTDTHAISRFLTLELLTTAWSRIALQLGYGGHDPFDHPVGKRFEFAGGRATGETIGFSSLWETSRGLEASIAKPLRVGL